MSIRTIIEIEMAYEKQFLQTPEEWAEVKRLLWQT